MIDNIFLKKFVDDLKYWGGKMAGGSLREDDTTDETSCF